MLNNNADSFRLISDSASNGLLGVTIVLIVVGVAWFVYDRF